MPAGAMVEPLSVGRIEGLRVNLLRYCLAGPGLDRRAACGPGIGPNDWRNRRTCLRCFRIGLCAGQCVGLLHIRSIGEASWLWVFKFFRRGAEPICHRRFITYLTIVNARLSRRAYVSGFPRSAGIDGPVPICIILRSMIRKAFKLVSVVAMTPALDADEVSRRPDKTT
jgi:hypothetical protein